MRYGVLGPLSVSDDGRPTVITASRDRIVLAMLLLHPSRTITPAELVEAVWGEQPPTTARGQLQSCVSRLRRTLPPDTIQTDPAGYGIRVGPGELDSAEFGRLLAAARGADDPAEARRDYRAALGLWRAAALPEIESHLVRRAAAVLDERRAVATEDWVDLEFGAGNERELLGELAELVDEFPLRERLRGQLMIALYRSGRQADALAEYRRARDTLVGELGVDPGPELQDLHRRILSGALAGAAPAPPPAAPAPDRVRCLPRTVGDFTGRADVVERLRTAIERAEGRAPAVVVVDGMAGSGKTTLALHVAALVGDRYPDAHLFVDLHGHSEKQPLEPAAALLVLLRQLGVPAERIPEDLVDRVGLWRTEMAGLKALVVFDNAASSAQIADLLPTASDGLALVTSRRRLIGLDNVHPESLDVLGEDEAVSLLERIAGPRVAAEPAAALDVVRRCGCLPLAIRLAGARLAHRARWRVADLGRRMADAALPELAAEQRTVVHAFALSYQQLPNLAQRVFRLLGLFPGPQFDALAVAALTGLALDDARDALDDLIDVHLVEEPSAEVFRLHDLLREYATALAGELPETERHAAVGALLNFELGVALASRRSAHPLGTSYSIGEPDPLRPELLAVLDDAGDRMELFRQNLGPLFDAAVQAGQPHFTWLIGRAVWPFLWSRAYFDDINNLLSLARREARAAGEPVAEAVSANYLASTLYRAAREDDALTILQEALPLLDEKRDLLPLATVLGNISALHAAAGRFPQSLEVSMRAWKLCRLYDDRMNALRMDVLSNTLSYLGQHADAVRFQRRRLQWQITTGERDGIIHSLIHITQMRLRAGDIDPVVAERNMRTARHWMDAGLYRLGQGDARIQLGRALRSQGRHAEALAELRAAADVFREIEHVHAAEDVHNEIALTLHLMGDDAGAEAGYRSVAFPGRRTSHLYLRAIALAGLGDVIVGRAPEEARGYWTEALRIFTASEVPERFAVAERLKRVQDQLQDGGGGGTMVA